MSTIDNSQELIDSRDIISRIEELEEVLQERYEQGQFTGEFDDWLVSSRDNSDPIHAAFGDEGQAVQCDIEELYALRKVAEQAKGYGDWEHGETLIRESYFTQYIEELINDCYEMPKGMNSGEWPYRHTKMDYEAAALEAKSDYTEIDFDGETYLMRS